MNDKRDYVSASDVGRHAFCPRALSLALHGKKPSREAQLKMELGTHAHQQLNHEIQKSDSRCFIASELFGIDHPVTHDFRAWRDSALKPYPLIGPCLIQLYYTISPSIVLLLRRFPRLRSIGTATLLIIHRKLYQPEEHSGHTLFISSPSAADLIHCDYRNSTEFEIQSGIHQGSRQGCLYRSREIYQNLDFQTLPVKSQT